jgi:AcrR family transcriptional regulator
VADEPRAGRGRAKARAGRRRSRARRPGPARASERRSHAERTAETRARLIAAVVESIAEVGLARTTAPEIARRAGVTWGAVQHHFGGKEGMLLAVLEDSFRRFAERLEAIPLAGTALEKRASLFIDRAWEHFSSPHYRSTFEILLHFARREARRGAARPARGAPPARNGWRERMFRGWDRIWRRLFADARAANGRRFVLQHYTISALSGLASTLVLEGGETALHPAELELLKRTLAKELNRSE